MPGFFGSFGTSLKHFIYFRLKHDNLVTVKEGENVRNKVVAYISLMKPLNNSKSTLYYGFCSVIGSLLAASWKVPIWTSLTVALAMTLSAFAIYALNDISDIKIDAINASERPLPSGQVSVGEAKTLTTVLFAASFLIACSVNLFALMFTVLFAFLGIAYSIRPLRLKDGVFGDVCWGLGIGVTVLGGATVAAITIGSIVAASTLAFLTAGCGFTKDLKDIEGDKALNIHTLPILLGEKRSITVMTIMSIAGFTLLFANVIFQTIDILYILSVILATFMFAYSIHLLYKNPFSKITYKKAYKIQAVVGFVIIISFVISALAK